MTTPLVPHMTSRCLSSHYKSMSNNLFLEQLLLEWGRDGTHANVTN